MILLNQRRICDDATILWQRRLVVVTGYNRRSHAVSCRIRRNGARGHSGAMSPALPDSPVSLALAPYGAVHCRPIPLVLVQLLTSVQHHRPFSRCRWAMHRISDAMEVSFRFRPAWKRTKHARGVPSRGACCRERSDKELHAIRAPRCLQFPSSSQPQSPACPAPSSSSGCASQNSRKAMSWAHVTLPTRDREDSIMTRLEKAPTRWPWVIPENWLSAAWLVMFGLGILLLLGALSV